MAELTALVVEDSPTMRQLIVFALRRIRESHAVVADLDLAVAVRVGGEGIVAVVPEATVERFASG